MRASLSVKSIATIGVTSVWGFSIGLPSGFTWEAVKPGLDSGLDWTGFWTGFWTQLYYVIGQCKHGVTVHV